MTTSTPVTFQDRFIPQRQRVPALHAISKGAYSPDDRISVSQAIRERGLNYEICVEPTVELIDGKQVTDKKHFTVYRPGAEPKIFGKVSRRYEVIQNRDLATMLDPISQIYPLVYLGSAKEGQIVWFSFDAGEYDIRVNGKDDPHHSYFNGVDFKKPGKAFVLAAYNQVLRCNNQLRAMLKRAEFVYPLNHTQGVTRLAAAIASYIPMLNQLAEEQRIAIQWIADKPMSDEGFKKYIEMVFPMPKITRKLTALTLATDTAHEPTHNLLQDAVQRALQNGNAELRDDHAKSTSEHQAAIERVERNRENSLLAWFNMSDQGLGGTVYSALNAVTETQYVSERVRGNVALDTFVGARTNVFDYATELAMKF